MSTVDEDGSVASSSDEKGGASVRAVVVAPSLFDILCGRGRECYEHPGNKIFRDMIDANLQRYTAAETKHARGTIVTGIVDTIRNSSPNGFLRYDSKHRTWTALAEYEARQKVGQTIREVLTQRSPTKRAAYRDRQAANKVKRFPKGGKGDGEEKHSEDISDPAPTKSPSSKPPMESPKPSSNAPAGFSKSPTKTALKKADSPCQAPGTVLSPDKFDILCGRGLDYYENPGNQLFRQVIEGALPRYTTAATKHAKSSIVSSLVDVIRKSSPNGFLRYDDEIRTWIKLDDYAARQKVGQTIREALTHRDPDKKAASRKRRAISKARRSSKANDGQYHDDQEMYYQPDEDTSSSDEGVGSQPEDATSSSQNTPSAAAMETHPLESILVAMTVQRQRDMNRVRDAVYAPLTGGFLNPQSSVYAPLPGGVLNPQSSAGSPLWQRYMLMLAASRGLQTNPE